jgi:hypothetical protein
METSLWIVQGLLAVVFLATGALKLTQSREKLAAGMMSWAADVTDCQFRGIGALEVMGAIGVVVPAALGLATVLTPLAAFGLALTMVGALATHARLGETERLIPPLLFLALAMLVAVERLGAHSI